MKPPQINNQPVAPKGFTLVELTLSIAMYTFISLVAVTSFVGIFGIYNKAQSLTRTQQQARESIDSLIRDLRNTEKVEYFATSGVVDSLNASARANPADADALSGSIRDFYCLTSTTSGFSRGYAALYLASTNKYHLIRMNDCTSTKNYELLIGPDTWLDAPSGGPGSPGLLQPCVSGEDLRPLQIKSVVVGSQPAIWDVTVAAHRGTRVKCVLGQEGIADQFSAETTLRTIVTTRK